MNKIGFRIYRFKEGPSVGLTVNEGYWTKKVVDIRDILKLYSSQDEFKFAMFLSFSEYGTYITIARSISGRGGDNTAAWIYVPNNIEVTGEEILQIIEIVKEELSASKGNTERLTQIFSKEYNEGEFAAYLPSASENIFAKRNDIFYPLKTILGEMRYQPIYSKYHAILIESPDGMEVVDKSVVDISTERLEETFVLCPPVPQDIPSGVTVHFDIQGSPQFKRPIRKKKGETVKLIFKRHGFDNIPYMTNVEENNQICGIPRFDWKKTVSRELFKVVAAHDINVNLTTDATITVNNEDLKWHQPIKIPERDAQRAIVRISVKGYETEEEHPNLLNTTNPITVKLHRAERAQTCKIELANGHTAEMSLRSKYLSNNKNESPIEGYRQEDGVLRYTNSGILKQRTIGFLMAVATFVVICISIALYQWFETHNFEWQLGWPVLKVEKVRSINKTATEDNASLSTNEVNTEEDWSLSKAIAYLDNDAGTWQRDSFIMYPDLANLFEYLNTYDVDNILNKTSSLQGSTQFKRVLDAINANIEKIHLNKDSAFSGNFCGEGDFTITVSNYINKLNKPVKQENPLEGIEDKNNTSKKAISGTSREQKDEASQSEVSENKRKIRGNVNNNKK